MPLLIVLDNMEYVVDSQLRLHSATFKSLLNFLLQFDNIKMLMAGERLPYADLAPQLLASGNPQKQSPKTLLPHRKNKMTVQFES